MKRLSCFILVFVAFTNVASGDEHVLDLPNLIEKINVATESRWKIQYDHRFKFLSIDSKARVNGALNDPSSNISFVTHEYYNMEIIFKFVPRITPENYSKEYFKRMARYEVARKKAKATLRPTRGKEDLSYEFYPQNKKEWDTYMTYVMERESFADLPEYHFGKIGLSFHATDSLSPRYANDKVYLGLEKDKALIFGLLKKYKVVK